MRVFKTKWFARFARQERIDDRNLVEAIRRAEKGLIDADLGGGLVKQRLARERQGRSGGYRTIIAYRSKHRAIFLYGFAKSRRANIGSDELTSLRKMGQRWIDADEDGIVSGVHEREIEEIFYGQENQSHR